MPLIGLEGVSAESVECKFFDTPEEAELILKEGIAATNAEDNGAINIWKGDDGLFRCEAMRYMISLEKKTYKHIGRVKIWIRHWLELIK